jgi:hypothetical protein
MNNPTIPTDFAGLKRLGKDFLDLLPTATLEEADNGWKCFGIAFLECDLKPHEEVQARALFSILSRKRLEHELTFY